MALLVPLALAGGGFDVTTRHIAGLAVWLVVVGLVVLGMASGAATARPLFLSAGLLGGLAVLSGVSSLWSGSVELSVIEADRVLTYLGIFLAAFLIAQTDERRQRFAEGLTIAVALIALIGLASRLLPHVVEVGESLGSGARLSYPLGYWNADGVVCGIAVTLLLWTSRQSSWRALRWLSVAAMPAVLLTLYFTYSRGGLLALAIGAGCLLALSQDRLWLLATLAVGAIGALPAVLAVQARHSLADNTANQAAVHQGVTVLIVLLAGIALALLLFAALRWVEERGGQLTGRAVAASRNPVVLRGIAVGIAVLAIGAAIAVGGRAWNQFSSRDIQFPNQPQQHFSEFSGAGRRDFWQVAIEAFGEKPIAGHGAGTYQFLWDRLRSFEWPLHDAHSLYLESFAELGLIGGLLVLALVGTLLWNGFSAWRAALQPRRERYAALLAAMLAFAVAAGIDWLWEIEAVGAIFFLAAGVMVAARCAQLVPTPEQPAALRDGRRYGLAIGGLAIAWISIIALVGPLLVERELDASRAAAAEGDIAKAVDRASRARSIEPWAASPYVQLGQLAELQGNYPTAIERFTQAIDREDQNWQWYYLRSKVEAKAGDAAAAKTDFRQARRLNPQAKCLRNGQECG